MIVPPHFFDGAKKRVVPAERNALAPCGYSRNRCPPWGIKSERVLWTMKRGFYAAAVEKAEDQRKPDGFFAHRKGAVIEFAVASGDPFDG